MTLGRLRAKIRKLNDDHEDEEMENGELNLVPYLDIVTNVIMFLLMTTTFSAALADINVSAPTTKSDSSDDDSSPPPDKPALNLTVSISEKGFTMAASGGVLHENDVPGHETAAAGRLPTIPKKGAEYDLDALTALAAKIKKNFGEETKVIVNANQDITYEVIINVMDAVRSDGTTTLFPDVLLAAGVN